MFLKLYQSRDYSLLSLHYQGCCINTNMIDIKMRDVHLSVCIGSRNVYMHVGE